MAESKPGDPKGILNPDAGKQNFTLSRFNPSEELHFFIEHYWMVEWALGDNTYQQDVLAYPSVHLVFEHNQTAIFGVVTGKFSRTLSGNGKVLGIKFRPGGFYPFLESPVSAFSDSVLALETVFDVNTTVVEKKVLAPDNKEQMVKRAEEFLIPHLPHKDDRVDLVNRIINEVKADKTLIEVGAIAKRFDVSKRSLQRIFNKYAGVPPKWVIKRYRLHEVAGILAEEPETDWAALAHELGYYDQAHFIKDFKSIVGQTPTEYTRNLQR